MLGVFSQISTANPLLIPSSSSSLSFPSRSRASWNPSPKSLPLGSRIFIRNLSYSINEASLIKLFSRFGHIVDVHIARHEETKEPKGYAFIQYYNQEDAILAIEEMDCKVMAGNCWHCRKLNEHLYWDHMKETRFHFIKVMKEDFSQSMEFPEKFARNFRVELPDDIWLEGPNGKLWDMRLYKEDNQLYFRDGWKEFVDVYDVKEGYTLMFKYAGNSSFTVQIFNQSGILSCES